MQTQTENLKAYDIVGHYLIAHREAKRTAGIVKEQKPVFLIAADIVADGKEQIEIGGALIYKTERRTWKYSAALDRRQQELDADKKAYEAKHGPDSVSRCWAVKESAGVK